MADEVVEKQEEEGGKKKSLMPIIIPVVAVVVAIAAGLAVYKFVVAPVLVVSDEEAADEEELEPIEKIPATVVPVNFEQSIATVIMDDPELPASQLLFSVSFDCLNQATADLIEKHKARFTHMLNGLHEFRTREELNDRLVKESIEKQALQKANEILQQLQEEPREDIKILSVFHTQFMVHDTL